MESAFPVPISRLGTRQLLLVFDSKKCSLLRLQPTITASPEDYIWRRSLPGTGAKGSFHFCLNFSSLRGGRLRWKLCYHFHGRLARSSHVTKARHVPWGRAQCFRLHASEPGAFLPLPAPARTPLPAHPSSSALVLFLSAVCCRLCIIVVWCSGMHACLDFIFCHFEG